MKRKTTIIITTAISVIAQVLLPFAINSAYNDRGYFAIGGEYALIFLSLICMFVCAENIIKMYMDLRERHKETTQKYHNMLYRMVTMDEQEETKEDCGDVKLIC